MKQTKLSPSSLNLMLDCPRCFWLHLVKGIKRPSGAFPSLPSGMDKILKEHFDRFMKNGILPPELKNLQGYKLFDNEERLKVWRNNFKGISYVEEESGILLHGAIDNILMKGKRLVVLDYKTRGFPLKENTHEHYQAQMDIYNFLLRKNGYKTEDYAYLLFYHPNKVLETGEVVFNTDIVKMRTNSKQGEKVFLDAIKVLKGEEPEANENCEYCHFSIKTGNLSEKMEKSL